MPPRRRRQKIKARKEKKDTSFADDDKADYFGDVDAEADEDTRGPDCALFSKELEEQLAEKKRREELKKLYKPGKRLEAKDPGTEVWYPAKVLEYDDDEHEILVHFENWSQRYDEWISVESPRLRPLPDEQTKTTKVFNVGDKVMATWTDSRKYPAEIKAVLPEEEKYEVLFYDGFVKTIKGTRITKLEETSTNAHQLPVTDAAPSSNPTNTLERSGLNTSQTSLEPKYSKEERRLRMRKLNIAELFHTNRRRRRRKGGNSEDSESGSDVELKSMQKTNKNKNASLLVSDSENSATGYRSESAWQSKLLGNDSDTCDRVESKHRTQTPVASSDIENKAGTQRTSSSLVGGSDIETRSVTGRMSSSSLGGSDIETITRTRRMSLSPCQGSDIETKIRRRRTSSSPHVDSDVESKSMTRRRSSSSLGVSDTETNTRTRRMSLSPFGGSDDNETRIRTQRTPLSPLVSSDLETRSRTQKTSLCPSEGSDIETRTRQERTFTSLLCGSDVQTRIRTRRTSSSPCDGSDREMKSTTQMTSLSPCVGSDIGIRANTRRKFSSPIKGRRRARTRKRAALCPLGCRDEEPRNRSRTRSPFGGSDIEHTARSVSHVGSEVSESDIELRKNYRKCVSEGEIDNVQSLTPSTYKRKRRRRKRWGKVSRRKKKAESFTDVSSYSGHSAAESEIGPALTTKGWTTTTQEKQSVTVQNIPDEITGELTTICIRSEKLPPGWSKYAMQRKPGQKDKKWSVYYLSPDGQKLMKKTDLLNYKSHFPVPEFDFSFRPKDQSELVEDLKSQSHPKVGSNSLSTPQETAVSDKVLLKTIKTLLPRKRKSEESLPSPVGADLDVTQKNLKGEAAENIVNGTLVIGHLKILIKDSQYCCPETKCQKIYRRQKAVLLHIQRNHPDCYRLTDTQNSDGLAQDESGGSTSSQTTASNSTAVPNDKLNSKEAVDGTTLRKETSEKKATGTRNFGFMMNFSTILEEEEEQGNTDGIERNREVDQEYQIRQQEEGKEFIEQEQAHLALNEKLLLPLEDSLQLLQDPIEIPVQKPKQLPCHQQEAIQHPESSQELVQKTELEVDQNPHLEKESSQDIEMELSQNQDMKSGQEMELGSEHELDSGPESEHNSLQLCELETGKKRSHEQMCETEPNWEPELEDAHESETEPISEPELDLDPNHCTDSGTTLNDELSGSAQGDSSQDGASIPSPTVKALLPVIRLQKLEEDKHLGNLPIVRKVLLEQQRQRNESGEDTGDQAGCKLEKRVRHTHGRSVHHLKRLLSGRLAHVKKRKPVIKYMKKLPLAEHTVLGSIVESEDSMEPHPEAVSERQRSPLVHLEKIKSSLDSNESELDERSQMSSTSDTQQSKNSSVREDIINCTCGSQEEHGLMVQCDICLCWQHGSCNNIQEEVDVPEKYVCTFCLNPPMERVAKKYSHSQDWLLSGKLPRLSVVSSDKQEKEEYAEMLKTSHELLSALIRLKKAVWATRVKVQTLCRRDHPKLYQWNEKWDSYTEVATDDDNDGNERNDDTLVNLDDNAIDVRTVQEEVMVNESVMIDPEREGENTNGNDEIVLKNVFLTLSSSSSTESLNNLPATFDVMAHVHAEDRCVPYDKYRIVEAATEFAVPVPEDVNTEQDSLSTDGSFLTEESSFCAPELSFMTPDVPSMHAGATYLVEGEKDVIDEDYEVLSRTLQDLFVQEEEKPPLIVEENENVTLNSLCETFDKNKSLSEIYSTSTEEQMADREEISVCEDLDEVDKTETHDDRYANLIKQTEGERCAAAIINLNTSNTGALHESECKYSSLNRETETVHHKMGMSVQTGVDERSTAQQAQSSEHGMRVRTIKTDPKITVQLVENVPGISVEKEKNKSIVVLQGVSDKPIMQKKRNDFDVPEQSGRNESDADLYTERTESAKDKHSSPVHAVKDKNDKTVQPVRNKVGILLHSSKSEVNVTAKEINDQPFFTKALSSTPIKHDCSSIAQDVTGITKSGNIQVPQRKLETVTPTAMNHNDIPLDNLLKDRAPFENSSSGESFDNMKKSANTGSESQCRERDSFTSISTNLSAQTGGSNEIGGDAGNDSPDSFDRILNALKTGSESVSCQENLSSDPDFESELAMLEETVHSIESDSCGPSGLEPVRNASNTLGPLPLSVFPRGNNISVNDYDTVQFEAFMDNANDAVVPNILNQTGEQCIKKINPVNINAAPVIFEDLLLRDIESAHEREKSSESSDFQLPIDAAQILQLADSMEESLCSSDSEHHRRVPVTGPQPEALIETEVCRNHLADHIAEEHKKLMEVLDAAEEQVKELESKCMDESENMRPADVKRHMNKIIKLLNLVNNLGKQDNVQAVKFVSNTK